MLILGGLFVAVGANGRRRDEEARRHEELLVAMQPRSQPTVIMPTAQIGQQLPDPFAPQSTMPDITTTLNAASEYIKGKRYNEARALLRTIPENIKAQEWLKRLDDPQYQ